MPLTCHCCSSCLGSLAAVGEGRRDFLHRKSNPALRCVIHLVPPNTPFSS